MRTARHPDIQLGVTEPPPAQPPAPWWWTRLIDGAHPWGSFDAGVGRHGVRRYWLVVYPPGASTAERRLARLWRGWPLTGAALGVVALMLLGNAEAPPTTVLAMVVAAYVGVGALLFMRVGHGRVNVRSMPVILAPGTADDDERRKYGEWQILVHILTAADGMLTTGAISPAEYKATWRHAYHRLESI
ncbi:hypothetical protein B8W69_11015 [Mycobacterium vulneris]|jgi:hypothetical protein|uniref:Uncharacterized protein n=1 Tax=Mycolicibacterium vulneris TaxID=547163 RepID=A0A1X2L4G7_9MYCO|nr:DUF6611 family protein [Mycolicibacterium vulneris]OSC28884.1 hypothetical protein B8W69_11015 [Mycolicibacterium vulneris]